MSQSPDRREWLALARSERVPAETLRQVAESVVGRSDPLLRGTAAAVARNPNTPPETLRLLAEHHPAAFCRNPALPFLLLECPDFIERLSRRARRLLLCQPDLPPSWVELLPPDGDAEAAQAAAQHVAIAGEIAAGAWECELWAYLRRSAQVPPGEGRAAQRELVTFGFAPAWSADFGPADREADDLIPAELPAEQYAIPAEIPEERRADIRALLGLDGKPRLPLGASRELRQAFHLKTGRAFLHHLADSEDVFVCLAVASHPAVGRETLTELLCRFAPTDYIPEDKPFFELLRAAVLLNPSTPIHILDEFARDANPALRRALRHRLNAPRDWTEAARDQTQREMQLWSLPEERRPLHRHYTIPCDVREKGLRVMCLCSTCTGESYGRLRWETVVAPPTPFCAIMAIAICPLTEEERRRRVRAAARSASHFARLGAALSPALSGEMKTLELLCGDACRLVRAVARARRDAADWRFNLTD